MGLLIENALVDGVRKNIYVKDNIIESIGSGGRRDDEVIDAKGMVALPGLINTHTHSAMTLLRGYGDDMLLHEWLRDKIWPAESNLGVEDVYWGSKLACLEMIKSGTTCFNDQYWFMEGTAKAVADMGLRAVLAEAYIDLFDEDKAAASMKKTKNFVEHIRSLKNDRIKPALGPHSIYTVSEKSLIELKEVSDELGLLIHFHLSETKKENNDFVKKTGMRPVEYLEKIGFLCARLVAAHCVWLEGAEYKTLAKYGVKVAHNPVSNMKLSVGSLIHYDKMKEAGLVVSIGTDGCASNNNLDMFEEMKFAALGQKIQSNDPTALPADETFRLASSGGASALDIKAGLIKPGLLADIILVDLRRPQLIPQHNLYSNLVYSANGSCVDTVVCDGRVLMRGGKVKGEYEIMEKAADVAQDVVSRN